jgi:hypothetical protein
MLNTLSMKRVILLVTMTMCIASAFGQHKRSKKQVRLANPKPTVVHSPSCDNLVNNLNTLKYDSVKVFSFGCPNGLELPQGLLYKQSSNSDGGFMLSEGFIDSTQHWLPVLSDGGRIMKQPDIDKIIKTFKNVYDDDYKDMESTGCLNPRMGIMFYRGGLVNAHMDVCFECSQINLEIFKNERVLFKFHLDILGADTDLAFRAVRDDYKLIECR